MYNEIVQHGGSIGIFCVLFFLLYREFISHSTKTERENITNMRIELEKFAQSSFQKLSSMHEMLRNVSNTQERMKDGGDRLLNAVERQSEAFHAFSTELKVLITKIEIAHKVE